MSIAALAIPTLQTERLLLRGAREEDFEAMLAMWQDPIARRYFHGGPMSREQAWGRFVRGIGMWALRGYGLFTIEEKATGDYVGLVGAFEVRRDMTPPIEDIPEVGWTLASRFHGRGYATEAALAALAWADAELDRPEMFCIVAPANAASVRVAEKCGFQTSYETIYEDAPILVMKRPPGGAPD